MPPATPWIRAALLLACRLPFVIFCLATGIYCFIAYVPVLYEQMIRNELFPWVPVAVALHPYMFLAFLLLAGSTLWRVDRRAALGFTAPLALYGVALAVFPLLPGLQSRTESLLWCLFWFIPPLALGILDLSLFLPRLKGRQARVVRETGLFQPAALAAIGATGFAALTSYQRGYAAGPALLLWSLLQHLLVFSVAAAWLTFALKWTNRRNLGLKGEAFAVAALLLLGLSVGIRQEVLVAFSFFSPVGFVISFLGSAAIVAAWLGLAVGVAAFEPRVPENGLALAVRPLAAPFPNERSLKIGMGVLLFLTAWLLPKAIHLVDWNFLMQRLFAVVSWGLWFALAYELRDRWQIPAKAAIAPAFVSLVALFWSVPPAGGRTYLGFDPSLQVASALVRPAPPDLPFYSALRLRTNVLPDYQVEASEVRLVDKFETKAGPKPNIFIFVVDSLRRDYVGAFNAKSPFTPNLDALAKDSVAFENAFTRYGGTGLSEPSIWVGGLLPAKFYVSPFKPLNNLQKLLEAENYRSYVSLDSILVRIVSPWPKLTELDHGIPTQKIDLCRTVDELITKLPPKPDGPLFVYSQPQNLHISLPKAPAHGMRYDGFDAPYAAALENVDRCFGKFIAHLRETGLYENSVVVLASDHGDSLGEEGRYGHSYNLFPEVLKIPLIVHLPNAMRLAFKWDVTSPAFLTDITPSLYYLLGHESLTITSLTGRPLFTRTDEERARYRRDHYLIGASYGAVFGVLSAEGNSLYIADAVNRRDFSYENGVRRDPTPDDRERNRRILDEELTSLARFFPPKAGVRLPR